MAPAEEFRSEPNGTERNRNEPNRFELSVSEKRGEKQPPRAARAALAKPRRGRSRSETRCAPAAVKPEKTLQKPDEPLEQRGGEAVLAAEARAHHRAELLVVAAQHHVGARAGEGERQQRLRPRLRQSQRQQRL